VTTSLAHRATVRTLVAAFVRTEATVRESFAALEAAQKDLNAVFALADGRREIDYRCDRHSGRTTKFNDVEYTIQEMRRSAWRYLVEKLELRRVMSASRWKELDEQLDKEEPPPITEEIVFGMAARYMSTLPELYEENVREVFEWLRPSTDGFGKKYKTNARYELGERVILSWMVERPYGTWRVWHDRQQRLVALDNVFSALDGQGLKAQSALSAAIGASPNGEGETDYFAFRCCKNRNLHLRFKRLDLLKRLNEIAGGKRLRGAA